ncbi:hypothetical protein [Variovorax sp. KK3]|uniref:hypothetical protein n=1 Tax=Variovorax sp. KK3 TaxID=1855728 RepID=UPI00117D8AC6|nr:hypothetical protein [Variovorax sp. KK3]
MVAEHPSKPGLLRSSAPWLIAAALAVGLFLYLRPAPFAIVEKQVSTLDPAQVIVLRTPGGTLEVSTLVKNEEFGWRSTYTCAWIDCGQRVGKVRLPVHYTYRIPLAETWTLRLQGDTYVLSVPAPEPRLPPGIDLSKAEFSSERGGLIAPSVAANRDMMLKNLGPELAQRAQRAEYLQQQMPSAEATVREFAQKWMREQMGEKGETKKAVRVEFRVGEIN